MRRILITLATAALMAACSQPAPQETPADTAPAAVEAPAPPRPAPLTLARTATCAAALDAFKGFGKGIPPAGMSIEQFGDAALITLRVVEVSIADEAGYTAAYDKAKAAWADQTPADIETALAACIDEVNG